MFTTVVGEMTSTMPERLPPGEWTHLAWSYDGTDKVVFVNGVETARQNGGTMAGHALPVIVGGHGRDAADPAGQSFNGAIDEVKVWDEVLTVAQIQAAMPQGACFCQRRRGSATDCVRRRRSESSTAPTPTTQTRDSDGHE